MRKLPAIIHLFILIALATGCKPSQEDLFRTPMPEYKPMPFWHINGELTTEGIIRQMTEAKELAGFSGVAVLPLSDRSETRPGTSPEFLSDEYFDRYIDILETARKLDMQVILYDDIDFPSGMAGGKMQELHPEYTRKRLDKFETDIKGPALYRYEVPEGQLMSAVAMNTESLERKDLSQFVNHGVLNWDVPAGNWKIMVFVMVIDGSHKKYLGVDYLDTIAVRHFINLTYEEYARRIGQYFGNVIQTVFFDDVGFFQYERAWTGKFNEKFIELNGFDPKPYYPALWYDIGPETEAARHAFFKTRAELLADGYLKLVSDWAKKHGLRDTGHPPGSYRKGPIDMNGDVLKYYRHTAMPLTDDIIDYGVGRHGFKLVSSAADYYDRPVVAVEIYGAYRENIFDSLMLYRPMMELFTRGINFVIPHGMWYNSEPGQIYIPPLVSPYSEKIAPALPAYSEFVGRSCFMLQGGRRVSEIGVMYPFESLAGWFRFESPLKQRFGTFVSPETDYLDISNLLTNEVRRDFTFVHPEHLVKGTFSPHEDFIRLDHSENFQEYKVMVLPGGNIVSYKTLELLKNFVQKGGTLLATTQLPYKAAELGYDHRVIELVKEIFDIDPLSQDGLDKNQTHLNTKQGIAAFIPNPGKQNLSDFLNRTQPAADVLFHPNPSLPDESGTLSYIHKIKDGRDIFYFANSSDKMIETDILLRGDFQIELWNPHSGLINKTIPHHSVAEHGVTYTKVALTLDPVKSVFLVGKAIK